MMMTRKSFRAGAAALALVGFATVALPAAPAFADEWHHHDGGYGYHGGYHDNGYHGGGHHDDDAGIAIIAGVAGLMLGAALASPPAYYTPPPEVIYAPAPAGYYGEPLQAMPASNVYRSQSGQYCREYQSTVRIGGRLQSSYGTACLSPDGSWHVVN